MTGSSRVTSRNFNAAPLVARGNLMESLRGTGRDEG